MNRNKGTSKRSLYKRLAEVKAENAKLRENLQKFKEGKIEEEDSFKCGSECGQVHEDMQEAFECAGGEEITAYRCKECKTLHEEEDDAIDCCG